MSNNLWKIKPLIAVNIFAILLFLSWIFEPTKSLWHSIDTTVFWGFNNSLDWGHTWRVMCAVANNRAFDLVAAIGIVTPFFLYAKKMKWSFKYIFSILIFAGLVIVPTLKIASALPIVVKSPTIHFMTTSTPAQLVSKSVSFKTKDFSLDSFPGDHGTVLVVFTGFAFFYLSRSYAVIVSMLAIFFVMPRVMVGAHWFSDEAVGALSLGLIVLSFVFFTPLHSFIRTKIELVLNIIVNRLKPSNKTT